MTVLSMFVESILLIRPETRTEEEGEDAEYKASCILDTRIYRTVFTL